MHLLSWQIAYVTFLCVSIDWYLRLKSRSTSCHLSSATNSTNGVYHSLNQDDPVVLSVLQLQPNSKNYPVFMCLFTSISFSV